VPFALSQRAGDGAQNAGPGAPLSLNPDTLVRIYLEDEDEVMTGEPARLTVAGIPDEPPVVETELLGVGSAITRQAVVPIAGKIRDDYGIVKARFDYRIDAVEDWQARAFAQPPRDYPREFQLGPGGSRSVEKFEVLPLDLKDGQKLVLTVYAEDGDNLNGPHSGRGERFTFQIVSADELLSILYAKELNLRKRFEQIIKEVQDTQQDLVLHRSRVAEALKLQQAAGASPKKDEMLRQIEEIRTAVAVAAERSLHQVRKNASETAAVESSFREILEELVNNAVHTRQMVDRIKELIIDPLVAIIESDFPRVDQSIGSFKVAHEKGSDPTPQIDASLEALAAMLARMQAILSEMQDLVDFHSAVDRLKTIIEDEQNLSDETKRLQKKNLIDRLKGDLKLE
jgi:hypothetical protein